MIRLDQTVVRTLLYSHHELRLREGAIGYWTALPAKCVGLPKITRWDQAAVISGGCGKTISANIAASTLYSQYVYVDPSRGVVVVKLSANPAYGTTKHEENNKDNENIAALRAIGRQFD